MKARSFIEQTRFDPTQLWAITQAFEQAWLAVQAPYIFESVREAARLRLAEIVLELSRQGIFDVDQLTKQSIEAMRRP